MIRRRETLGVLAALPFALAAGARADEKTAAEVKPDDMVLGRADAPVTIIEYSSLTCPHCARFHRETLPRLKETYIDTGKARLVYRDFPFDRGALYAAALAHCAGRARFFPFVDALFRSQGQWGRAKDPLAALKQMGAFGGLKAADVDACFADQALLDRILSGRLEGAQKFGVKATPTFIINGEKLVGAQPFDRFAVVIDHLLAES